MRPAATRSPAGVHCGAGVAQLRAPVPRPAAVQASDALRSASEEKKHQIACVLIFNSPPVGCAPLVKMKGTPAAVTPSCVKSWRSKLTCWIPSKSTAKVTVRWKIRSCLKRVTNPRVVEDGLRNSNAADRKEDTTTPTPTGDCDGLCSTFNLLVGVNIG